MIISKHTALTPPPARSSATPTPAAAPEQPTAAADQAALGALPARILNVSPRAVAKVESQLQGHALKEGELLVKLKPGMDIALMGDFAQEYGAHVLERFDIPQSVYKAFGGDLLHLKLPAGISTSEAIAAMREDARVAYAEPNDIIQLDDPGQGQQPSDPEPQPPEPGVPNDLHPDLWGLRNQGQTGGTAGSDISAVGAWQITTGSRENGPLIAVIDTGADYNHPDLAANIWTNPNEVADGTDTDGNGVIDDIHGYNAFADHGDPLDGHSHGTHCSGTIGGVANNDLGVAGVNWEARIMPVKIFSDSGSTTADAIVRGILYATRMGADITSNSWGGTRPSDAIRDAFAASPALHICAAGNSRTDTDRSPFYPMGYDLDNIVAVAATDHNDQRASFSNYGATTVDVAAPGKDILSTVPNGEYASYSGTSMATPHVSGVAALIKTQYPEASHREIKERLIYSSDRIAQLEGVSFSGGRVNAERALEDDQVAPGAPNDFRGIEATSRGLSLSWTASGDDGWCGNSSAFDLRMGDQAITGESFEEASPLQTSAPGVTGTLENFHMDLAPSTEERQFHFALKVVDNVGNRSELRTAAVTVPAATVAFQDSFDAEESAWTGDGTWGRVEVEGRGKVWTDSPDGDYGNDQESSLTSGPIDLSATRGNLLTFDASHELSWGDSVAVQVSEDGETWVDLERINRNSEGWTSYSIDLSGYDGTEEVQLRFHMTTNARTADDGFYLDNLAILGDPA